MPKTIKVYTPAELQKKNPRAFDSALERFRNSNTEIPWCNEILDSLKAVFEHTSGIVLLDYSIDAYGYSYVKFCFTSDSKVEDLTGQRALAWLENNLLDDIRYKWGMRHLKERVWKSEHIKSLDRSDGAFIHQAGELKSCPFTGYCADDDFILALQKSLASGDTLKDAFENLADEAEKMFRDEIEYQNSEENFLEQDYLFTIDGRMI